MDQNTLLIGLGAAGIGYMALNGDGSGGGSGGRSPDVRVDDGQVPIGDAGDMVLDGEVPDVDTWGSDNPFENAENTGTTQLGTTAIREEFNSVVEELQGGYETPTRRAGGHLL